MDPIALLPFIVLIGAMFLMTRSAKKKQRQASQMRDQMQPGTGIRTIGGMYAVVKEVRDDAVLVEIEPGVHALFAKNAIGAVLPDEEFDRIVNGGEGEELDVDTVVPDDASALTRDEDSPADTKLDLGKKDSVADTPDDEADEDAKATADASEEPKVDAAKADTTGSKDAKRDGDSDSK
ncbi:MULTISPECIES: preprotein translocase subunit YajC [unclassified Streptomyces]|uniref:preprotein translocase subunit YajC n=1 Tax=unclassified Streptomyces TaxID=2593676 RepID=UPI002DD8A749|nr:MULTISPECIES: preprotein translocase subunit YajC [unclassified Streptomyces]WSA96296.1 preprotein translocase subunit YajC [Streptomyces sp. NBC_01795]WSB80710.1 preprotein translocase subunit YajC [Streptomyces sp. NBC_01775]WSS11081.1 preprotein translocase subunit YajC [Streptomyces sp. NBC_01186]WSS39789.1 preprotein translocase subunit YajC [Streptomyces sp. NBC_01187]